VPFWVNKSPQKAVWREIRQTHAARWETFITLMVLLTYVARGGKYLGFPIISSEPGSLP
jgi:hypothetical protein